MNSRHPTPRAGAAVEAGDAEVNVSTYPTRGILQVPVWTWEVPAYFFLGGLAAGSALLAFACELLGNRTLARRARLGAFAAIALSPPLLVSDLGRPERFYNMLRVFRPTSPMNVGTWIITAFGSAAGAAAISDLTGLLKPIGRPASATAALLAPPLGTYTAVLVSQSSVPAWHEARRHLPFLFGASALAAAGGMAAAVTPSESSRPARMLAVGAALGEVAAAELMQRRLGELGDVYKTGPGGAYSKLARGSALAGAALIGLFGRHRLVSAAGGASIMLGALSERFAVWKAGIESARRT